MRTIERKRERERERERESGRVEDYELFIDATSVFYVKKIVIYK